MPKLPNFFIVGAPKAATTSLYYYLDQHPQIYMSAIKEPHYFAAEIRKENCGPHLRRRLERDAGDLRAFLAGPMREKRFGGIVEDWEDYLRLFANATTEEALGEASVCYLWSPTAAAAIARQIPEARILVMLRNPAERAFSQYLQGLSGGLIRWTFREHIERSLRYQTREYCLFYPFLELGLYAQQLRRYLELFPRRVWIGFYDDFKMRAPEVFQEICRFLEVATDFVPDMSRRRMEPALPRNAAAAWLRRTGLYEAVARMTPKHWRGPIRRRLTHARGAQRMETADRCFLIDYYRDDLRELEHLLDRSFEAWLR